MSFVGGAMGTVISGSAGGLATVSALDAGASPGITPETVAAQSLGNSAAVTQGPARR